jgi:hypothetical protein
MGIEKFKEFMANKVANADKKETWVQLAKLTEQAERYDGKNTQVSLATYLCTIYIVQYTVSAYQPVVVALR